MLRGLMSDAKCRAWLASLENPTKTRHGFKIFTIPGDLTSDWIKLHGQHETGTERFILDQLRQGTTFIDVGANIGYFSILAAVERGMNVVSFEPQRPIADLLERSVAYNHVESFVRVERIALSSVPSTMRMTSCPGNSGHSQLAGTEESGAQPYLVSVVVFDDWLKQNPVESVSVCKIDSEGSELDILQGMRGLLDRDGPAIVVEVIEDFLVGFGSSGAGIIELLKGHDYIDVSSRYLVHGDRNRYFVKMRAN
jgi:FkbM family methyltransferase